MNKVKQKTRRQVRTRAKFKGTKDMPRLSVYRSNKFIYAQLIDDEKGQTIFSVSEKLLDKEKNMKKQEKAKALGLMIAKKAQEHKIAKVVFDRGSYSYHGRVSEVAKGAREGGLKL